MATSPKATSPRRPSPDRVIDAALALAAERRWRDVGMRDIAKEAGLTLAELHAMFLSKSAILAAFTRRIDAAVLAGTDPEAGAEPARDRLFDVLARRLEALRPHRTALGSIVRDVATAPPLLPGAACRLIGSMAWSLEAAGIGASGPAGRMRTRALAAIYLATLCVFLRDDSEDLGPTMANLDRALGRVDWLVSRVCRTGRAGRSRAPAGEAA